MAEEINFKRPTDTLHLQDVYSGREVGITHPDHGSYIRLNNGGDVEIVVGDGLAIIMHGKTKSITFVADTIKFLTNDGDSIRWNNNSFNSRATDFTQPALLPLRVDEMKSLYDGADYYHSEGDDEGADGH